MKLPPKIKYSLFAVLATSWCTGLSFFIMNRWVRVEGEFGLEQHPWQFSILQLHGAAAFLMMILYGYLLGTHVQRNWGNKRQRRMGLVLVAAQGFQIITAYLLYYVAGEASRDYITYAHVSVGFIFPFVLIAHVRSAMKLRKSA